MLSILNFISFLILVYLLLYGVYLLTINVKACLGAPKFLSGINPENYYVGNQYKKFCIIIFANSKTKNLERLLNALNNQTYSKENYSVHCIFAKDSNTPVYTPECLLGAQIHCIENEEFFNKNKALNVFIERLIPDSKFDAYIFLGADRYVDNKYLECANKCVQKYKTGVFTGKTVLLPIFKEHNIRGKVLEAKQTFLNNTVKVARRMFELSTVIDSENCIITEDILERTGRVCFETREDELKYSLFLASNEIKPLYLPYFETFIEAENYNPTTSNVQVRLSLFKYYFKLLPKKPWYFIEFVFSLLHPNVALITVMYLWLLYASFRQVSTLTGAINGKYIIHLGIFYLVVWSIGLIASKLSFKQILSFLLYPFYSIGYNFQKITTDVSKTALQRTITEEKNVKSATIDTLVTDGKKNVECKMDLISEDGMRRVILRFRKKRIISDESIRMCDAVWSISKKVKGHGLTLKICDNCKYFQITQNGTVDLLQGMCSINLQSGGERFETLIWNCCPYFTSENKETVIESLKKE